MSLFYSTTCIMYYVMVIPNIHFLKMEKEIFRYCKIESKRRKKTRILNAKLSKKASDNPGIIQQDFFGYQNETEK